MSGVESLTITVGIALRLGVFYQGRPLWLDEALLAGNILTRTPDEMFDPLDSRQMSPLGFLWGVWTVTQLAGTGERALRLLPLIAGVVALFAFARLTRQVLEPGTALLATALAALSPLLIYYSAELKSYEFDLLGAVLLMLATIALIREPSRRAWMLWSLAAAFGALFSTAAPFFIGGNAIAVLVASPLYRSPKAIVRLVSAGIPAAGIFLLQLLTVYDSARTTDFMRRTWSPQFLTLSWSGLAGSVDFARELAMTILYGVEPPRKVMTIALAIAVLGVISLGRRSPSTAVLLIGPIVLAAVASLARWWPLTTRLLLFGVPAVVIALAAGLAAISGAAPKMMRVPLFVVLSLAQVGLVGLGFPRSLELSTARFVALPEALRYVGARLGDSTTVYLSRDLSAACTYYLVWHPDHAELPGNPPDRSCSLRGARTVLGRWTTAFNSATGTEAEINTAWQGFTEAEGRRILDYPAAEIWAVIGPSRLQQTVPSWLEEAGATKLAEHTMRGLRILHYKTR